MRTFLAALGGAAVGACAALLFAPQSGRATRSLLRDKTVKCTGDVGEFVQGKSTHIQNKMKGYTHMACDMAEKAKSAVGSFVRHDTESETTVL
jgi:gas vesicle protein